VKVSSSQLLTIAMQAALKAGHILERGFGTLFEISSKPGKHNLVTDYDKLSEKTIIATILKEFPDHSFLAEESGISHAGGPVTWIIDPLDGTVNFAKTIPIFSVSIAACVDGEVVCGVVYQPITKELFFGEKGKGAFLNGSRLQVTTTPALSESFLSTGFPYDVDKNPLHCIEAFASIAQLGAPIRRLGSAAIDLSYVAAGRFDAFWEVVLEPWDVGAGKLFIEEAGGLVTRYDGSPVKPLMRGPILATNSHIHPEMLKKLTL
jgi:myo-inositol-1(or 4)-monophosphatase